MSDFTTPDPGEPIMVTVNGVSYETRLYDGVQRFVPDRDVMAMVEELLKNFNHRSPVRVPASLHRRPNAVVRRMAEMNRTDYYGLNEMVMDLHRGEIEFEDWVHFNVLHGYSVCGFMDAIESQASNMGLGEAYTGDDGEEYEDYSAVFTLANPLWDSCDNDA